MGGARNNLYPGSDAETIGKSPVLFSACIRLICYIDRFLCLIRYKRAVPHRILQDQRDWQPAALTLSIFSKSNRPFSFSVSSPSLTAALTAWAIRSSTPSTLVTNPSQAGPG